MNSTVTYIPEVQTIKICWRHSGYPTTDDSFDGKIFLRSNINQSEIRSLDVINDVEQGQPNLDRGWYDTALNKTGKNTFEVKVPLLKVGHFSYKCFAELPNGEILWAAGDNNFINVEV